MESIKQRNTFDRINDMRQKIAEGLLYTHSRLNANTGKTLEAASFLYALVELLTEKGIISEAELDLHKREVGQRLVQEFQDRAMGALLQDPEYDKYTFKDGVTINCRERIAHCRASCCRIPFALSKQDINEGRIRWELGQPYLIAHGKDGYCEHFDRRKFGCTVYEQRPVPCRGFDCRQDERIWLDFKKMISNPEILRDNWPGCLAPNKDAHTASNVDASAASGSVEATTIHTPVSKT